MLNKVWMVLFPPLLSKIVAESSIPSIHCPSLSLKLNVNICIYNCCNLILSNLKFALSGSKIRMCPRFPKFDAKLEVKLSLTYLTYIWQVYRLVTIFWNYGFGACFRSNPQESQVMRLGFLCYLSSLKLITVSPIDFLIFNYCSTSSGTSPQHLLIVFYAKLRHLCFLL